MLLHSWRTVPDTFPSSVVQCCPSRTTHDAKAKIHCLEFFLRAWSGTVWVRAAVPRYRYDRQGERVSVNMFLYLPLRRHAHSGMTSFTCCAHGRGTVILGFEQANKYTILNESGDTVALMSEELGNVGRQIGRQILRTRRPFVATVFSPDGQIISGDGGLE